MSDPSVARPLIIAHRGASGYRPEHTLEAYVVAVRQGADFIEPDLVATRDGVLIVRHENEIGGTTDVARRFPQRRTTKVIDGQEVSGWFTEDFTLADLRLLRAKERLDSRSHVHDGQWPVPTFEEVLALGARMSRERNRPVGVYPETKHPSYFRSIGLPLEEPLVAALDAHGDHGPVFIQSFEPSSLRRLRDLTSRPLIQLLDQVGGPWDRVGAGEKVSFGDLATPAGLRAVAGYAAGIGPHKRLIVPERSDGSLGLPTVLVADAHAEGLVVHPWTFRNEPAFLHPAYGGDPTREIRQFRDLGVDGVFTDFPDVAVAAIAAGT